MHVEQYQIPNAECEPPDGGSSNDKLLSGQITKRPVSMHLKEEEDNFGRFRTALISFISFARPFHPLIQPNVEDVPSAAHTTYNHLQ